MVRPTFLLPVIGFTARRISVLDLVASRSTRPKIFRPARRSDYPSSLVLGAKQGLEGKRNHRAVFSRQRIAMVIFKRFYADNNALVNSFPLALKLFQPVRISLGNCSSPTFTQYPLGIANKDGFSGNPDDAPFSSAMKMRRCLLIKAEISSAVRVEIASGSAIRVHPNSVNRQDSRDGRSPSQ